MAPRRLLGLACLILAVPIVLGARASDPRAEVEKTLQTLKFSAADLASLQNGAVIAHADSTADNELLAQAAVKIRVPHADVVSYYGQMITYVDGAVTLGFGRFSTPAVPADVAQLTFDRGEADVMKACRPGNCDIRLGGAGMTALQAAVDWKASDYVEQVNAYARKAAVDYVTAYRARGDEALITFDDSSKPVSLRAQWQGILDSSANVQAFLPELARYFRDYPKGTLPGGRDILYWIRENYGRKPTVSIVHGVVYAAPGSADRTVVAQKYLYASHYYDASFALASIVSGSENGAPVSYIVYSNRSRGDLLRGGFGGIGRGVARSQARKAAEQTLATIRDVLQKAAGR